MFVSEDGWVGNPYCLASHKGDYRDVDGWYVGYSRKNVEIEVVIDDGPPVRLRYPDGPISTCT
jgi:hypothetical protein